MRPRVLSESVLAPGQRLVVSGEVLTVHPSSSADGSWVRGTLQRADGVRIPFVGSPHLRIRAGCEVRLTGVREDSPEHGTQLRIVDCLELKLPQTDGGVVTYLSENLAGCGRARARRVVQVMGRGCIEPILENPTCLTALFPGRIGAQMALAAEALGRAVEADRAALDLAVRLHSAGVTPGMVRRVLSYFRTPEAAEIVLLRRPYRLLEVPDIGGSGSV